MSNKARLIFGVILMLPGIAALIVLIKTLLFRDFSDLKAALFITGLGMFLTGIDLIGESFESVEE